MASESDKLELHQLGYLRLYNKKHQLRCEILALKQACARKERFVNHKANELTSEMPNNSFFKRVSTYDTKCKIQQRQKLLNKINTMMKCYEKLLIGEIKSLTSLRSLINCQIRLTNNDLKMLDAPIASNTVYPFKMLKKMCIDILLEQHATEVIGFITMSTDQGLNKILAKILSEELEVLVRERENISDNREKLKAYSRDLSSSLPQGMIAESVSPYRYYEFSFEKSDRLIDVIYRLLTNQVVSLDEFDTLTSHKIKIYHHSSNETETRQPFAFLAKYRQYIPLEVGPDEKHIHSFNTRCMG